MKTRVNPRSPNVDRFLEVLAAAGRLGYKFSFHIKNKPHILDKWISKFYEPELNGHGYKYDLKNQLKPLDKADFCIEHEFMFPWMFEDFESFEEIKKRINKVTQPDPTQSDTNKALLRNAAEKLELNADQINNILLLSEAIAGLEQSKKVEASHLAEAIQYTVKP